MKQVCTFLVLLFPILISAQQISSLERFQLPLDTFRNGEDGTTRFEDGAVIYPVTFSSAFNFWSGGFALSTVQDSVTSGFENLYAAKALTGNRGSQHYLVGQQGATLRFDSSVAKAQPKGIYVTNSTYAYNSMRDGDQFAKAFGGPDGSDPDFFKLTIYGYAGDTIPTDSVEFFLADYRFEADSLDYIVEEWTLVDLTPLGQVDSLEFRLTSSDAGDFGINTPAFYCLDDLVYDTDAPLPDYITGLEQPYVGIDSFDNGIDQSGGFAFANAFFPNTYSTDFGGFWSGGWALSSKTDTTTRGFTNQYAAITGSGLDGSAQYAVGQQNTIIELDSLAAGKPVQGIYVTNSTYAYFSMLEGDQFAKQFGGPDGTDPDFFKLIVRGYAGGSLVADSAEVFLADYRFEEDSLDFIQRDWKFVDLSTLGPVDSLQFTLSSSDVGDFGINTPLYFCVDNLTTFDPATNIAIAADSSAIQAWAVNCEIERGQQDIALMGSDTVSAGEASNATGPADGTVVSLGDAGAATLTFEQPIEDGPGFDFVVFENGFPAGDAYFLELAFVEVSSDGENFFRFPAISNTDTSEQVGTFGLLRPENISNLAGQFAGQLGTPFDLQELAGTEGLDLDQVTHVRIVDVVGALADSIASLDSRGNKINDPYPTAFISGGFDLESVGVINVGVLVSTTDPVTVDLKIYPNPTSASLTLQLPDGKQAAQVRLFDATGRRATVPRDGNQLDLGDLSDGMYVLQVQVAGSWISRRIVKR